MLNVNPKVFISYSSNTGDFTDLMKMKLEKENIIVWKDTIEIRAGMEWRNEIDHGLLKSDIIIVLLNESSTKSPYVTYEWSFSLGNGKHILPVLIEDCEVHPRIKVLQYIDFKDNKRPWQNLITRIKELNMNAPDKTKSNVTLENIYEAIKALAISNAKQENRKVEPYDFENANEQINNTRNYLKSIKDKINTLLWVDDNPKQRKYERQVFESLGFMFDLAHSTEQALNLLKANNYSAVISDMNRPEGNEEGLILLNRIRGGNNNIPFFFYTGDDSIEARTRAKKFGAQGLTKMAVELIDIVSTTLMK